MPGEREPTPLGCVQHFQIEAVLFGAMLLGAFNISISKTNCHPERSATEAAAI